jgi:hypothetical protein
MGPGDGSGSLIIFPRRPGAPCGAERVALEVPDRIDATIERFLRMVLPPTGTTS